MFPVSDEGRSNGRLALVTVVIITINILVFLFELSLGANVETFFRTYGAVPREILTGRDIPPAGPHPVWLQLLTSMFIHGGWLHILGNMAYLRVFGDDIEEALGTIAYLLFYLGAGIVASLTQIFLSGAGDTTPSIGASGAIAGVLGAYLVLFPNRQINVLLPALFFLTSRVSALTLLGFWFLLQFFNGLTALSEGAVALGGVAVWAHIGGFIAGVVVALFLRGSGNSQRRYASRMR